MYQQTFVLGSYTMKYQVIISNNGVAHYTRVCWYNNWTDWHNFNRANLMQKDIRTKSGRTEQRYGNLSVVTTNAQGENAVSGFTNCLCFHLALDIRNAQQYFLLSVGFIMNNQYYGSVISSKGNLTMATNTVGTVAIQGGAAEFVKQTFLLIPQVDYSVK